MKKLKYWGAFFVFVLILMRPQTAVSAAQNAMKTWYSSIAPTLLPFLVLMPLLTGNEACSAYEALFSRWMRPVFGLPGAAAPAIIVGMITGSPGGAMALKRISENSGISASDTKRIALAVGGVSPAYLVMAVGLSLYNSISLGLKLAGIQILIQIMMLSILPRKWETARIQAAPETERDPNNSIQNAVLSLLGICGYMVFFSVLAGVLVDFIGAGRGKCILLMMDLPSGLVALAKNTMPMRVKMLLQGTAIGFTGLCIIAQNMDTLKTMGISWKEYLCARLTTSAMFGVICSLFEGEKGLELHKGLIGMKETYAFSLLFIAIALIPPLFFLTKNLFLNIRDVRKK